MLPETRREFHRQLNELRSSHALTRSLSQRSGFNVADSCRSCDLDGLDFDDPRLFGKAVPLRNGLWSERLSFEPELCCEPICVGGADGSLVGAFSGFGNCSAPCVDRFDCEGSRACFKTGIVRSGSPLPGPPDAGRLPHMFGPMFSSRSCVVTPRSGQSRSRVSSASRGHSPAAAEKGIIVRAKCDVGSPQVSAAISMTSQPVAFELILLPPTGAAPLRHWFGLLRTAVQECNFGAPELAQVVLEFAVLCAQPDVINHECAEDASLNMYVVMLLDAISKYQTHPVLSIWLVEALVHVHGYLGDSRTQVAVPIFSAVADVAVRFASDGFPDVHVRLIAALANVASPDCRGSTAVVDYLLSMLDGHWGRVPTLTVEHALATLCAIRVAHRLDDQINHTLLIVRAFRSDSHLVIRALVTLAELCEVLGMELGVQEYVVSNDVLLAASKTLADSGIPAGADVVHLVVTLVDLYPSHRKVSGAGLRCLSAMAKLTPEHLQAIVADDLRAVVAAQRRHKSSRSVHLHAAEVVCLAAKRDRGLISEAAVLIAAQALRSFAPDSAVVSVAIEALQLAVCMPSHFWTVLEAVPSTEIAEFGELHCGDRQVAAPLCDLLASEAFLHNEAQADLVSSGTVAVPIRILRVLSCVRCIAAACRALAALVFESDSAAAQACALGVVPLLFKVLDGVAPSHSKPEDVEPVRAVLMALAVVLADRETRRSFCQYPDDVGIAVDAMLFAMVAGAPRDPDVLAQGCRALGALTAAEDSSVQSATFASVNRELVRSAAERAQREFPSFEGGYEFCESLLRHFPSKHFGGRILSPTGVQLHNIGHTTAKMSTIHGAQRSSVLATEVVEGVAVFSSLRSFGVPVTVEPPILTPRHIAASRLGRLPTPLRTASASICAKPLHASGSLFSGLHSSGARAASLSPSQRFAADGPRDRTKLWPPGRSQEVHNSARGDPGLITRMFGPAETPHEVVPPGVVRDEHGAGDDGFFSWAFGSSTPRGAAHVRQENPSSLALDYGSPRGPTRRPEEPSQDGDMLSAVAALAPPAPSVKVSRRRPERAPEVVVDEAHRTPDEFSIEGFWDQIGETLVDLIDGPQVQPERKKPHSKSTKRKKSAKRHGG